MSTVIKVENLSKKYIIRHQKQGSYTALRDVIANRVKSIGRSRIGKGMAEEFWALKDISFEVKQGDRIGIIGRNGAGKSTLLKVLSRITEPTTGKISLNGRVASLLEVGTGFHPELTGRENIYLNGAVLGMSKADIKKRFNEIVNFAEIEKFLDTPVKRYSSGMYVRLAFAVAAHLEPEILIVDEVLAVGDVQFQKKCLGKMEDVSAKEGRTVLFVSHNMPMISSLCDRCILLHHGKVIRDGTSAEVIQYYYTNGLSLNGAVDYYKEHKKPGDSTAQLLRACLRNETGDLVTSVQIDENIIIEMEYEILSNAAEVTPNFHFYTADGVNAFITTDAAIDFKAEIKKAPGIYRSRCRIPGNFLNSGTYYVGFALSTLKNSTVHFYMPNLLCFDIIDPISGVLTRGQYVGSMPGAVRPLLDWECEKLS